MHPQIRPTSAKWEGQFGHHLVLPAKYSYCIPTSERWSHKGLGAVVPLPGRGEAWCLVWPIGLGKNFIDSLLL